MKRRFVAVLRKTDGSFSIVSAYATGFGDAELEVSRRYLHRREFIGATLESVAWCDYMDVLPGWQD